jgi:hypothetical protein
LFIEQFNWQPKLEDLSFDSIGEDDTIWFERTFEEGEVFEVVEDLNSDKAPGLDGLLWHSSKLVGMFLKKIL